MRVTPSHGKGQLKILTSMCVRCPTCCEAPAGSSVAVSSPGWWEQAPPQCPLPSLCPLPGNRLSIALPCNCKWLFNYIKTSCGAQPYHFTCVLSEEEGEEEEEETVDGEDLDEVHTETSGEEEEEEVEEEGAEKTSQPPQQDPEPQSAVGEPLAEPAPVPQLAEPAPVPQPAAPAGQVSAPSAPLPCQ